MVFAAPLRRPVFGAPSAFDATASTKSAARFTISAAPITVSLTARERGRLMHVGGGLRTVFFMVFAGLDFLRELDDFFAALDDFFAGLDVSYANSRRRACARLS